MLNRFTTRKEIEEQFKCINKMESKEEREAGGYEGHGGIVISQSEEKLFIDDRAVNNIVFGSARSGKGKYFILPSIDVYSRAKEKPSIIIYDPKDEIYDAFNKKLKDRGYRIEVLDLEKKELSTIKYNPINLIVETCKKEDFSRAYFLTKEITDSIYGVISEKQDGDKYWSYSVKNLVNAMILGVIERHIAENKEEELTINDIGNMLFELASKDVEGKNGLEIYFDKFDKNSMAKKLFDNSNFNKKNTRGSILIEAVKKLEISNFNYGNNIDLKNIGFKLEEDKPFAVFLKGQNFSNMNNAIASIFITQLYYILSKESLKYLGKCEREVIFMLDEFQNMPEISEFDNMLSIGVSRNIKFNLILQTIGQLKRKYGEGYKQILINCTNNFYIYSSDIETVEYFSEKLKHLKNRMQLMNLNDGEIIITRAKNRDCYNNKIEPYPIYNKSKNTYKYEYEK